MNSLSLTFLNKPQLIYLYTVKWFQVLFIVCTQLNGLSLEKD